MDGVERVSTIEKLLDWLLGEDDDVELDRIVTEKEKRTHALVQQAQDHNNARHA